MDQSWRNFSIYIYIKYILQSPDTNDEAYDLILLSFSFKIKKFVCLWAIITYQLGLDFLIPLHIDYSKNYFLPKPQKTHGDNFFWFFLMTQRRRVSMCQIDYARSSTLYRLLTWDNSRDQEYIVWMVSFKSSNS